MVFFFQAMTPKGGDLAKSVRLGVSSDGATVRSSGENAIQWTQGRGSATMYGDPVISRVADDLWTLTAWSGPTDPRGAGKMLYRAGSCPQVDDREVVAIGAANRSGCVKAESVMTGKTSTVFREGGANWLTHSVNGELGLLKVAEGGTDLRSVPGICREEQAARSLADLSVGESTPIFTQGQAKGLKLSDSAITRRTDGTWVVFVKGQEQTAGCQAGSTCELCGRSIYRSTSSDLLSWSPLEKVITQASVPEAFTATDGKVWLYYVDFAKTCAKGDVNMAAMAPISGAYETAGSHKLSTPKEVSFPDESFQTQGGHGATNANPIVLPTAAARTALQSCISGVDPVVSTGVSPSSPAPTPSAPQATPSRPNAQQGRPDTRPARPGRNGGKPHREQGR
jgi:hypothetical protein